MEPLLCEPCVGPGQGLADRYAVKDGQARDRARVVEGEAEGDLAAAVVSGEVEALVTQECHEGDQVGRHPRLDCWEWSALTGAGLDWP